MICLVGAPGVVLVCGGCLELFGVSCGCLL